MANATVTVQPASSQPQTATKSQPRKLNLVPKDKTSIQTLIKDAMCPAIDYCTLDPSEISRLQAAAEGLAQAALAHEGRDNDEDFDVRLEALRECVRSSKSGKPIKLSRRQARQCASVYAAYLYAQIESCAEVCIQF